MSGFKLLFFVYFMVVLSYCNVIDDESLSPHEYAETKGVDASYVPRGRVINIGDLPIYEAPDNINKRRMLIAVYDIFGFSQPNMKQITDLMALQGGGFRTILPDFFRGQHAELTGSIDLVEHDFAAWIQRFADWDTVVRPDLLNIVRYYQNQGVEEFAMFGMCWGGRIGTSVAIELSDYFKAIGIVHPSNVANSEAHLVRLPMYLLPSSAQPDMLPFLQVLRNNFGDNSGHRRFDDMPHGFSGARGNFSNPLNQMHVNEVISILGTFFERNLSDTH